MNNKNDNRNIKTMTSDPSLKRTSKFLSLVLRHQPQQLGLDMDDAGWVAVDRLVANAQRAGHPLTLELLRQIVAQSDKQRFAFSEDGLRIRANQGHSVPVDLQLAPVLPPDWLYHGTAAGRVAAILQEGLQKQRRHHVHLSEDREVALAVGRRYGPPVLLLVDSRRMAADGHTFFRSDNGVWLVEAVPPAYLRQL
ncbi:RNA 2'-phosphotransferase [Eleftheria terrae]|uniref:RNA 2'-phosphotransferase n=1 Tax=Eleftheria terrae TaxID=1597781 RepID=UPI00263BB303|nr:RNA 2'-phosphotransferase [Eleftheria terrae]WKB55012.1 RNA 2'-phosphotransferase [Eleftheria terrae]